MADEVLGVDIGGVLWAQHWRWNFWTAVPDAFKVLKKLNQERFKDRVFIVSHVLPLGKMTTSLWLWWHDVCAVTGIGCKKIHFCRKRREKASICRRLGITHFIDDRAEIMAYLHESGIKNLYLFQGRQEEINYHMDILPFVLPVTSWQEISLKLLD